MKIGGISLNLFPQVAGGFVLLLYAATLCGTQRMEIRRFKKPFGYSHSIVRNCLQFVPVCRSLFWFVLFPPSLKNCRESMGSYLGHGFRGGAGRLRGSRWFTKAGKWVLKVFWLYGKREAAGRPCFCYALSPGRHRPPASARAYRASSILATNSLAHLIASSTSWSTGRPSARTAYISSHPFCLAMAGGQACARL